MANIFTAPTDTSQQMADSIPQGRAWGTKNLEGSNTRGLINSLAVAHNKVQQQAELLDQQFRIDQTTDLLTDWETSVGLPDECTVGTYPTIAQRRNAVIKRIRKDPVVILPVSGYTYEGSMQAYIDEALPDLTVILYAGETYLAANPGAFTANPKFVIVAELQTDGLGFGAPPPTPNPRAYSFQLNFPFGSWVDVTKLTCVMNKIIPANVIFLTYFT